MNGSPKESGQKKAVNFVTKSRSTSPKMGRNSLKIEEHSYKQLVFTRILLDSDEKNGPMIKFGHSEKATKF